MLALIGLTANKRSTYLQSLSIVRIIEYRSLSPQSLESKRRLVNTRTISRIRREPGTRGSQTADLR